MGRPTRFDSIPYSIALPYSYTIPSCTRPTSTRYTSHIFLEFCPCFYRFCEFTRTPKNCIIEGNETVVPCAHVQPCESDSNNCQTGEVFVSTVRIDSWVSQGVPSRLVSFRGPKGVSYLLAPPFIVKHC